MRAILCTTFFAVAIGGCMIQNLSPVSALTDEVYAINDESRWARIDLATERVMPEYREAYLTSHREWGHDIQIADSDTTHVTISDDEDSAISIVTISWYDQRTMELYQTVIRQRWTHTDNGFRLDQERIVGGSDRLLDLPEQEEGGSEEPSSTHADRPSNAS